MTLEERRAERAKRLKAETAERVRVLKRNAKRAGVEIVMDGDDFWVGGWEDAVDLDAAEGEVQYQWEDDDLQCFETIQHWLPGREGYASDGSHRVDAETRRKVRELEW